MPLRSWFRSHRRKPGTRRATARRNDLLRPELLEPRAMLSATELAEPVLVDSPMDPPRCESIELSLIDETGEWNGADPVIFTCGMPVEAGDFDEPWAAWSFVPFDPGANDGDSETAWAAEDWTWEPMLELAFMSFMGDEDPTEFFPTGDWADESFVELAFMSDMDGETPPDVWTMVPTGEERDDEVPSELMFFTLGGEPPAEPLENVAESGPVVDGEPAPSFLTSGIPVPFAETAATPLRVVRGGENLAAWRRIAPRIPADLRVAQIQLHTTGHRETGEHAERALGKPEKIELLKPAWDLASDLSDLSAA